MPIPRAIEASFAQSAESAILDYIIFNMKISGFLHPTVTSDRRISASRGPILLRFGQEVPLEVLLTSSESQVTRHYRYRVIHRVVACSHQEKENMSDAN